MPVDVGACLFGGHAFQGHPDGDALHQGGHGRQLERGGQLRLAEEDETDQRLVLLLDVGEQPQLVQGGRGEQMPFIYYQQVRPVGLQVGLDQQVDDLQGVGPKPGRVGAEAGGDGAVQLAWSCLRSVQFDDPVPADGHLGQEQAEERALAGPGLSNHHPDLAGGQQLLQPGKGGRKLTGREGVLRADEFGEGQTLQAKVFAQRPGGQLIDGISFQWSSFLSSLLDLLKAAILMASR